MSKSIEVPDAVYDAITRVASTSGRSPAEILAEYFLPASASQQPAAKPGESLFDRMQEFIGSVEGTGENGSERHSEVFGEMLEEQRKRGRLGCCATPGRSSA